jgi:hypothetical protein
MEKKWFRRREFWGNLLTVVSLALVTFFPKDSQWFLIGTFLGAALSIMGYRKGYQADNLSKVETKILDAIPNELTGVKGSGAKQGKR